MLNLNRSVRLPADMQAALEKLAKAEDRSLSYVIKKILAEYLRARKLIK
jgi:predicted transcriptional regulator